MNSSISQRERRDYRWEEREKLNDRFWLHMALIFFTGALAYGMYVFTPNVQAENKIDYKSVHTVQQLDQFIKQNPGAVTNL